MAHEWRVWFRDNYFLAALREKIIRQNIINVWLSFTSIRHEKVVYTHVHFISFELKRVRRQSEVMFASHFSSAPVGHEQIVGHNIQSGLFLGDNLRWRLIGPSSPNRHKKIISEIIGLSPTLSRHWTLHINTFKCFVHCCHNPKSTCDSACDVKKASQAILYHCIAVPIKPTIKFRVSAWMEERKLRHVRHLNFILTTIIYLLHEVAVESKRFEVTYSRDSWLIKKSSSSSLSKEFRLILKSSSFRTRLIDGFPGGTSVDDFPNVFSGNCVTKIIDNSKTKLIIACKHDKYEGKYIKTWLLLVVRTLLFHFFLSVRWFEWIVWRSEAPLNVNKISLEKFTQKVTFRVSSFGHNRT